MGGAFRNCKKIIQHAIRIIWLKIKVKKKYRLNPSDLIRFIVQLLVVYSALNVFLERAFVLVDGDKANVIIKLKPKNESLEKLALEFNNELINYSNYSNLFKTSKEIKNAILGRVLLTNNPESFLEND